MENVNSVIKQMEPVELLGSGALDMVWEVFREFEAPDYSARGVQEFRDFIHPAFISDMMAQKKLIVWCHFEANRPVGLIALRPPGHISLLFVDKAYHRRGIARALFQRARKHCGDFEMTVNSSPYAREIYHRLGFADTGPEQTVNGLRFIPMRQESSYRE